MRTQQLKSRVFNVLEYKSDDYITRLVGIFFIVLITLNVAEVVLATVEPLSEQLGTLFWAIEIFSLSVFTVGYVLRLWSCTSDERYRRPISGRLVFALTPLVLIDFAAIAPTYAMFLLPSGPSINFLFIRALRLVRIFRVFKLQRYDNSLAIINRVLARKAREILTVVFVGTIVLVVAASLVYFAEYTAQPENFSNIPAAMWWTFLTIVSPDSREFLPLTAAGKLLGGIIALIAIGLIALPTGILSAGFVQEFQEEGERNRPCPHCGERIDDP